MPFPLNEKQCLDVVAEHHVGVLSVTVEDDRAPVVTPMWYVLREDGSVFITTLPRSRKGRVMELGTRFAILAMDESRYRYATVEGPITDIHVTTDEERIEIASRFLPEEAIAQYLEFTREGQAGNRTITMVPDRIWGVSHFDVGDELELTPEEVRGQDAAEAAA